VAVGRTLQERGFQSALIGRRGGLEEEIAIQENLTFYGVDAGKIDRQRPRAGELLLAWRGVMQARQVLREVQPALVIGFGGYASLPGTLAAQQLRIPTILHEQNARLGLTQRLAQRRAQLVTTSHLRVAGLRGTPTWVGMPVREQRFPRELARSRLGLQAEPATILVMGGSQGSLTLNRRVPPVLLGLFGREGSHRNLGIQVLHACGPRWLGEVVPAVARVPWYHPVAYTDATLAWSAADLAITRSGSSTLAEASYHGVPLVMIPLPSAAEGHQLANARAQEAAGAGVVVTESELASLGSAVLSSLSADTLAARRAAALTLSPAGAAARLADQVERLLGVPA
jgi:UDP-N-acetylglucosamine--N-acetylmuramyl-(pentapeptide) pyrophosphoryl-undecaprenol N-acetylglucosamine transferase